MPLRPAASVHLIAFIVRSSMHKTVKSSGLVCWIKPNVKQHFMYEYIGNFILKPVSDRDIALVAGPEEACVTTS